MTPQVFNMTPRKRRKNRHATDNVSHQRPNPGEFWRQRGKGEAQGHSRHKRMLENVPKIQQGGRGCQNKNARNMELTDITEKEQVR